MNYIKINLTCNNNNNILGCSMLLLLLLLSYFKNTVSSSMLEKALLEDYFPSASTSFVCKILFKSAAFKPFG